MTVYELKTLPIDTLVKLHNMAGGNRIYCMDDDEDFNRVDDIVTEHLRVNVIRYYGNLIQLCHTL